MAKQTQRSTKPPSKGAKTFSKPPSKKHVQERQAVEEDDDSIEAMVDDDDEEDEQEDLSCLSDDELRKRFELGLLQKRHSIPLATHPRGALISRADNIKDDARLKISLADFQVSHSLPWPETFLVSAPFPSGISVNDDFQREAAFIQQALAAATQAEALLKSHSIPYIRPNDYFAETVKTEDHMRRVRSKLVEQSKAIEASDQARRNRELKKVGKKIQQEVLVKRAHEKSAAIKSASKYKQGLDNKIFDSEEGFDIDLDDDDDGSKQKNGKKHQRNASAPKMSRSSRNEKFGFKRRDKKNTAESSADMSRWDKTARKAKYGGKVAKKAPQKRPGKARRQQSKGGRN